MDRVCVQIGLDKTMEYDCLLYPQDIAENHKKLRKIRLPKIFEPEDEWQIYGIDCMTESVKYMRNYYTKANDRNYQTGRLQIHEYYVSGESNENLEYAYGNQNSVSHRSISLSDLFTELKIKQCDLLVLDIEGVELEVLSKYNWRIKPIYMVVETHQAGWKLDDLLVCMREINYAPISCNTANIGFNADNSINYICYEYHFIDTAFLPIHKFIDIHGGGRIRTYIHRDHENLIYD